MALESTLPKSMKCLQITEFKKPYHFSTSTPLPHIERDNEILVRVAVAGYCHGDLMIQNSDIQNLPPGARLPMIPSHEGAGVVVAVGTKVSNIKIGDRVGTMAYKNPCLKCIDCNNERRTYCENMQLSGVTVDGAAAEYMIADSDSTILIPASISFEAAAPLMCAGSTVYAGIKRADLKPGELIAIIGVGALGHLGIQLAKCLGLRVVAVDARKAPLELAKELKYAPDYIVDATDGVESALKEIGEGVHAAVIVTDANSAFDFGMKLTRKHGTVVAVGLPSEAFLVHYSDMIYRNITLKGAQLGNPQVTREMVDLVAANGIEVKTRVYALDDIDTLLKDYHAESRAGKFVMRISEDR